MKQYKVTIIGALLFTIFTAHSTGLHHDDSDEEYEQNFEEKNFENSKKNRTKKFLRQVAQYNRQKKQYNRTKHKQAWSEKSQKQKNHLVMHQILKQ